MEFQGGKTETGRVAQLTGNSTPQQLFEVWVDVPSEKWVFQLGWVLKKFQVGRYKFQVGVGGKTWKCVLNSWKPPQIPQKYGMCQDGKVESSLPMQNGLFQLRVEISTLVVLVTVLNISS